MIGVKHRGAKCMKIERGNYPRYAFVRYFRELLSLLVFISGGYSAVSLPNN